MYEEIKVTLTYADGKQREETWCESTGLPSDYEETFTAAELRYWLMENIKTAEHFSPHCYDMVIKFTAVDTICDYEGNEIKRTTATYYRG